MKKDLGGCGQLQLSCECSQCLGWLTSFWQHFGRRKFANEKRKNKEKITRRGCHHTVLGTWYIRVHLPCGGFSTFGRWTSEMAPCRCILWVVLACCGQTGSSCTLASRQRPCPEGAVSQKHRAVCHLQPQTMGIGHPTRRGTSTGSCMQIFAVFDSHWAAPVPWQCPCLQGADAFSTADSVSFCFSCRLYSF